MTAEQHHKLESLRTWVIAQRNLLEAALPAIPNPEHSIHHIQKLAEWQEALESVLSPPSQPARSVTSSTHWTPDLRPYWVSWWCRKSDVDNLAMLRPWWVAGERAEFDDTDVSYNICAAIMAESAQDAKLVIEASFTKPAEIEWRFCYEQEPGWSPFTSRFPRSDWMIWPGTDGK